MSASSLLSGRGPRSARSGCRPACGSGRAEGRLHRGAEGGETPGLRSHRAAGAWAMAAAGSWQGWVRGGCGPCDVVASGGREPRRSRRAGHLTRAWPRAGRRGQLVGGQGRRGRGRPGRRGAAAPLGALVRSDGDPPGCRRGPAGHLLGHRGGAPAAVRRLAGRPRLGLGQAARPGHRHDADRRPARPVRHGRG